MAALKVREAAKEREAQESAAVAESAMMATSSEAAPANAGGLTGNTAGTGELNIGAHIAHIQHNSLPTQMVIVRGSTLFND